MSKKDRLLKKIKRLEVKMANLEYKIENLKTEYKFRVAMEDDTADWQQFEDYD